MFYNVLLVVLAGHEVALFQAVRGTSRHQRNSQDFTVAAGMHNKWLRAAARLPGTLLLLCSAAVALPSSADDLGIRATVSNSGLEYAASAAAPLLSSLVAQNLSVPDIDCHVSAGFILEVYVPCGTDAECLAGKDLRYNLHSCQHYFGASRAHCRPQQHLTTQDW